MKEIRQPLMGGGRADKNQLASNCQKLLYYHNEIIFVIIFVAVCHLSQINKVLILPSNQHFYNLLITIFISLSIFPGPISNKFVNISL